MVWLKIFLVLGAAMGAARGRHVSRVEVYYFMIEYWGETRSGAYSCDPELDCQFVVGDDERLLDAFWNASHLNGGKSNQHPITFPVSTATIALYNVHSLWEKLKSVHPHEYCALPTEWAMVETAEAQSRYQGMVTRSFRHFDGNISKHTSSTVRMVDKNANLQAADLLPLRPFANLVKGASYVARYGHLNSTSSICVFAKVLPFSVVR
jgi:hypothetical protein